MMMTTFMMIADDHDELGHGHGNWCWLFPLDGGVVAMVVLMVAVVEIGTTFLVVVLPLLLPLLTVTATASAVEPLILSAKTMLSGIVLPMPAMLLQVWAELMRTRTLSLDDMSEPKTVSVAWVQATGA